VAVSSSGAVAICYIQKVGAKRQREMCCTWQPPCHCSLICVYASARIACLCEAYSLN